MARAFLEMSQVVRSFALLLLLLAFAASVSGCEWLFGIRERPEWAQGGASAGVTNGVDQNAAPGSAGVVTAGAGGAPRADASLGGRDAQENLAGAGAGGVDSGLAGEAGSGDSGCTATCPELGVARCSEADAQICEKSQDCQRWVSAGPCVDRALVHVGTCTGTIVDPLWILTARRCVSDADGNLLDPISVSAPPALSKIYLQASSVVLHPDPAIDVALIHLETPLALGQPDIQLFDGQARALSGHEIVSYGYGLLGQLSSFSCDAPSSNVCSEDETCDADAQRCRATTPVPRGVITRLAGLADNAEYASVVANGKYLRVQPAEDSLQGGLGGPSFFAGQLIAVNSGPEFLSYAPRFRNWLRGQISPRSLALSSAELALSSPSASLGQPLTGDYNGDGLADIAWIADSSGPQRGQVMVSLNLGSGAFDEPKLWHSSFVIADERPDVGDFDGDGRDDLIAFTADARANVATSDGVRFGAVELWNELMSYAGEHPSVGDLNGDGRADTVDFVTYQGWGDVWATLSCASRVPPAKCSTSRSLSSRYSWETSFNGEFDEPLVGDVDGDNLADLVTLTPEGEISVSLTARQRCDWNHYCDDGTCWSGLGICPNSPGLAVLSGDWAVGHDSQWLTQFPTLPLLFFLADMNGDGLTDAVAFTSSGHGLNGPIVSLSTGSYFEPPSSLVAASIEANALPRLADVDGDGRADVLTITSDDRGTRVFVRYSR